MGGWSADRSGRLLVALLPAVALAIVLLLIVNAGFEAPVLGSLLAAGGFVLIAVADIPLLVGAYAGGATAD